jgi:photosystem II cytochrome b559 subunit alpha
MAGITGERPLGDIVTDPQFWLLHLINFPAVFLSGWLFVSTGLAYDVFGTPRSDQYYGGSFEAYQNGSPIIMDRSTAKEKLDRYFQSQVQQVPPLR